MHTILIKALFSVLTKVAMAACGEKVIAWALFKVAEEAAKSSKTTVDDDFVAMVKAEYEKTKEKI